MSTIDIIPEDDDDVPAFALTVHDDGEGDIEIATHIISDPSPLNHASLGLMYGLAVLMLDRQGAMEQVIEALLKAGPMSETDCADAINLLMQQDPHDRPN